MPHIRQVAACQKLQCTVNLPAMPDSNDAYSKRRINNVINDPVIADAYTPSSLFSRQLLAAVRPRVLTKSCNRIKNPS